MNSTEKGFTLIELLVVISIISLLSSIVFSSLNLAKERGRMAGGISLGTNLYRTYGDDSIGVWNLDEGSGAIAFNSAGTGPGSGAITAATWTSSGPNGKPALVLDKNNSAKVSLGSITTNSNVTVAAWVKTSSSFQQPAFSNRNGNGLYFGTTAAGKFFAFYSGGVPAGMTSVKVVNDDKWHHLVWTSDGSTGKMYIDGQLDSTLSQTRSTWTASGYIGYDTNNNEYFTGSLAQVAVYTRTLGSADVNALYALGPQALFAQKQAQQNVGLVSKSLRR